MNSNNEILGIVFREKGQIPHTKGIEKILLLEDSFHASNYFFTAGRDSVIKFWKNNSESNNYQLISNLEHHVDWVNDLAFDPTSKLLFSCSNDKTVMLWKLKDSHYNEFNSFQSNYLISKYNSDYIKCLNFNTETKTLFAGGYDGLITGYKIEEFNTKNTMTYSRDNFIFNTKENSIFSIDSDKTGKTLIASVYQNQILGIDVRQKKEIFQLRGHKDIVRSIKISPDSKLVITVSSDKTVKLWDLHTHKVLKNYDFHQDQSVTSLSVNADFTKMVTGSIKGDIYFTDIPKSIYCKIDTIKDENILSLAISNDSHTIFCSTSKNKLVEYKINNPHKAEKNNRTQNKQNTNTKQNNTIQKEVFIQSNFLKATKIEFLDEIVKYQIMKNKIYMITEDLKKRVSIYNLMRLAKVHEFQNTTLEKIGEILDKYDNATLRTWFNADIKLGTISLNFQKENLFINQMNFNMEFIEKIIEKLNSLNAGTLLDFTEIANSFKFEIKSSSNLSTPSLGSSMKPNSKMISQKEKMNSNGYYLMKLIFNNYLSSKITKIKDFILGNFEDNKNYLHQLLLGEEDSKHDLSHTTSNLSYNNNQVVFKHFSNKNLFIYSLIDSCIYPAPFMNEINTSYILPSYLKDLFNIPSLSNIGGLKQEKIDVIIKNKKKELRLKQSKGPDQFDELEAQSVVTVTKLKNWMISSYLDVNHLKNQLSNEIESIKDPERKNSVQKFFSVDGNLMNLIDFSFKDNVIVKNNSMTIGDIREILFKNESLQVDLIYASVLTLINRGVIPT